MQGLQPTQCSHTPMLRHLTQQEHRQLLRNVCIMPLGVLALGEQDTGARQHAKVMNILSNQEVNDLVCTEMYGVLEALASGPAQAMAANGSSMVGVGMCPEGIEQNPVIYDLMSEWAFRCVWAKPCCHYYPQIHNDKGPLTGK